MGKSRDDNWLRAELLKAYDKSELTRHAWAKAACVDYAVVHGFVGGSRDVTLATASRLADVLGLRIVKGR